MKTLKTFRDYHIYENKKDAKDIVDTIVKRALDHLEFVLEFGLIPNDDELNDKINQILNQIWSSSEAHPDIRTTLENDRKKLVDKITKKFFDESK